MAKPFDALMKRLAHFKPEVLLTFLLPGAVFLEEKPLELKLTEFDVDALLLIEWDRQEMLLHVEFQTFNDYKMAERILRYNVLARIEHKLPVLSIVIYFFQDGNIPPSPLCWHTPTGHSVLEFHFFSIKLWELSVEQLRSPGHVGLLALVPLTKGGTNHEVITHSLTSVYKTEDADLLYFGYNLARLVFAKISQAELEWFQRSFAYMQERIEQSPLYQWTLKHGMDMGLEQGIEMGLEQGIEKGLAQGLEKGLEQGIEKGLAQGLEKGREMFLALVEAKYAQSDLPRFAREVVEKIDSYEVLQHLNVQISLAPTLEEARAALLACTQGNNPQQH